MNRRSLVHTDQLAAVERAKCQQPIEVKRMDFAQRQVIDKNKEKRKEEKRRNEKRGGKRGEEMRQRKEERRREMGDDGVVM